MITGENKKKFEAWLIESNTCEKVFGITCVRFGCTLVPFNQLPFEMQIGVYLAYYDSLEIDVTVIKFRTVFDWGVLANNTFPKGRTRISRNEPTKKPLK